MRQKYEEFHFVEISTNIYQMQQIICLVLQIVFPLTCEKMVAKTWMCYLYI